MKKNDCLPGSGPLLSVLAHDLNNVLGGVAGALSLIEFEKEDSPHLHNQAYDSYLNIISDSSSRASGIVQQLLIFTRQSADKLEDIPLAASIERIVAVCGASFGPGLTIHAAPVPSEARILGNCIQFEKLLLSLLVRGCQSRQTDEEISVAVEPGRAPSGLHYWRLRIQGPAFDSTEVGELTSWYDPELSLSVSAPGKVEIRFPAAEDT
jgi:two-component system, cell cycle sensor histidine kinase and response regulator CckA